MMQVLDHARNLTVSQGESLDQVSAMGACAHYDLCAKLHNRPITTSQRLSKILRSAITSSAPDIGVTERCSVLQNSDPFSNKTSTLRYFIASGTSAVLGQPFWA